MGGQERQPVGPGPRGERGLQRRQERLPVLHPEEPRGEGAVAGQMLEAEGGAELLPEGLVAAGCTHL